MPGRGGQEEYLAIPSPFFFHFSQVFHFAHRDIFWLNLLCYFFFSSSYLALSLLLQQTRTFIISQSPTNFVAPYRYSSIKYVVYWKFSEIIVERIFSSPRGGGGGGG